MEIPTRPGDVLSQPTRARLFALLSELRRPAGTEELAERVKLHPNGVRVHLDRLRESGLVQRTRERQARGRPRDAWAISATARPGGDPPSAYANLGRWLVRTMVAEEIQVSDVEETGRQIGRELMADADHSPEVRFHTALVAMGFQPRRDANPDGTLTYCLGNCPYREAVREKQALVCGLHRGMTRGMLEVSEPRTSLVRFSPRDPDEAGCLIELRGPIADEAAERRLVEPS